MTITKGQLADLLSGLGSSYASSGGYTGQRSLLTIGAILEALADETRLEMEAGGQQTRASTDAGHEKKVRIP